jgi:hypothetical protein
MTPVRRVILLATLAACCGPSAAAAQTPAAAHAAPAIKSMQMRSTGHNPGADYYVRVQVRLRVCAIRGRSSVTFRETLRLSGHTFGSHSRTRHFRQTASCQSRTFNWKLRQEFFGVGTYRVAAKVRDRDGHVSSTVSRKQTTND